MIQTIFGIIEILRTKFFVEIYTIPSRMIGFVGFVLLLLVPLTNDSYLLRILTFVYIYVIFSASWDLLAGYAGQINLGHAFYFGIGAYSTTLLHVYTGIPIWFTIPFAAIFTALSGIILAIPSLRLRGAYLALATLAFPVLLSELIASFPEVTGGEYGLSSSLLSDSYVFNYYFVLAMAAICCFIIWKVAHSRIGIILGAIRDDEIKARMCGIDTSRYKIMIYMVAGFFAGISGALYAHIMGYVGPSSAHILKSLEPILYTVFGGIGTVHGSIVGTIILYGGLEFLPVTETEKMIIYGIVVIIFLLFMPHGLTVWVRDKLEKECLKCKKPNLFSKKRCIACSSPLEVVTEKKLKVP
jgi:branched-chain amino acid transport system permease protein